MYIHFRVRLQITQVISQASSAGDRDREVQGEEWEEKERKKKEHTEKTLSLRSAQLKGSENILLFRIAR